MSESKKNSNLVVQSNSFINFKHSLSLAESKLFLSVIAQIKFEDVEFNKFYTINVNDFMNSIESKNKGIHRQIADVAESLTSKKFRQINPDGSFLFINYISSAEYKTGTGTIEIEISNKLVPYLLGLKSHFTKYDLRNILRLKSTYSIVLYQILKQYEKIQSRYFNLDDLKDILDAANYTNFSHFKMRVLEPARKEFLEKCDIIFDYEETKSNKKVVGVKFLISKNPKIQHEKYLPTLPVVVEKKEEPKSLLNTLKSQCKDIELWEELNHLLTTHFATKDIDTIINHLKEPIAIYEAISFVLANPKIKNKTAYILKADNLGTGNWANFKQSKKAKNIQVKKSNTLVKDKIETNFRRWKEAFFKDAYNDIPLSDRIKQEQKLLNESDFSFIFSEDGVIKPIFEYIVAEEYYKSDDLKQSDLIKGYIKQVEKEYKVKISINSNFEIIYPEDF